MLISGNWLKLELITNIYIRLGENDILTLAHLFRC